MFADGKLRTCLIPIGGFLNHSVSPLFFYWCASSYVKLEAHSKSAVAWFLQLLGIVGTSDRITTKVAACLPMISKIFAGPNSMPLCAIKYASEDAPKKCLYDFLDCFVLLN